MLTWLLRGREEVGKAHVPGGIEVDWAHGSGGHLVRKSSGRPQSRSRVSWCSRACALLRAGFARVVLRSDTEPAITARAATGRRLAGYIVTDVVPQDSSE